MVDQRVQLAVEHLGQAGVVALQDVYHQDLPPSTWDEPLREAILGAQAQLWTEFVQSPDLVEYLAFPRLCALAENAWSGDADWLDFTSRLVMHEPRLAELKVNYRPNRTYDRT